MQKGSAVITLVIIVLILSAILVFVAWLPTSMVKNESVTIPTPSLAPVVQNTPAPANAIKNTNDLDSATKSLDTTDLNKLDSELTKMDSEASF